MKYVYVYQDGIHRKETLMQRLAATFAHDTVTFCSADDILNGCLNAETRLFVMPGGADLAYCEKLNGAGNRAIRAYVENGGTYLGICAGAYYACRRIEWAKDDPEFSICQDRELGFFAGTAIGPVYDWLEDHDITKSWDNVALLKTESGTSSALYSAGPVFVPDASSTHSVLARFQTLPDQPIAMLEAPAGKGRVILSSCHIEFHPEHTTRDLLESVRVRSCNASREWSEKVCSEFSQAPSADLWDRYIKPIASISVKVAA